MKSNIHIKNTINENDELPTITKYSYEQIAIISNARIAKGLSQQQLAKLISPTLGPNFITNIENGQTNFDSRTYNTILRKLNIIVYFFYFLIFVYFFFESASRFRCQRIK